MKKILSLLLLFSAITLHSFAGGCAFTYQVDSINNLSVSFTYIGWPGPQTYAWDFGDGSGTSTLQNPSYVYSSPGNYTVTLNTLDTNGIPCTSSVVAVVGSSTNCSFMISGTTSVPATIDFTNTSVGFIVSYQWDFGDGSNSVVQNPSHTYVIAGTYSVCLVTMDTLGLSCTYCQNVTISPGCSAAFQAASTSLTTYFIENSVNTNLPAMNYQWDFGDGGTSTVRFPAHVFSTAGNYNVCLSITDNATCFDSVCQSVNVDSIPPAGCNADFIFTQMQSYSIAIVNVSYGIGNSFNWDFGDGSTSNQAFPSHTYASTGSYIICLSTSDSTGCTSTFCDSLNVDSLGNITTRTVSGFTVNVIPPSDLLQFAGQIENSKISVHPNPAHEFFVVNIQDINSDCDFVLHSITGRVCKTGRLLPGKNVIDLLQLSDGMYFLEVKNERGDRKCWKIIKE